MITQVTLTDFKSYRSGTLHLAPLTVLVGANAAGKSNVIEALHLLAKIASGERLSFLGRQEGEVVFRGRPERLGYREARSFGISCETTEPEWNRFEMQLGFAGDSDELHVIDEKIVGIQSTVPLYEIDGEPQGAGSDVFVRYNNFARGGKKPAVVCSSLMAIVTQLLSEIRFRPENEESRRVIPAVAQRYVESLSGIVFLEPEPSAMRGYGHKTDKTLRKHGENLSGVVYHLCRDPEKKRVLLDFVQSLPEQNIRDVDFVETPRDEVMLQLTETFGGTESRYDAELLSDGTLRVLSVAAVLLSAPEQSLVVIEEIDNGVHPSRVAELLERISALAKQRSLRVLISSHNPALLDALPADAVPEVVFCYRSPEDGSSRLVRLRDIPDYPELIAQGSVGHLMTRGLLDRFVKAHPGPEAKRRQAIDWLESLKSVGAAD